MEMQDKIKDCQHVLASEIPSLSDMAADMVQDLDPQARMPPRARMG